MAKVWKYGKVWHPSKQFFDGFKTFGLECFACDETAHVENLRFQEMDWDTSLLWARELNVCHDLTRVPIVQHCFWAIGVPTLWESSQGPLNERHLASIKSCQKTQIEPYADSGRQIWLWIPQDQIKVQESHLKPFLQQCTIKPWNHSVEVKHLLLRRLRNIDLSRQTSKLLRNYSHVVRLCLLWNYGGLQFDLDTFFIKSLDPVLCKYRTQVASSGKLLFVMSSEDPDLDLGIQKCFDSKNFMQCYVPQWQTLPKIAFQGFPNPYKIKAKDLFTKSSWTTSYQNLFSGLFAFSYDLQFCKEVKDSVWSQICKDLHS